MLAIFMAKADVPEDNSAPGSICLHHGTDEPSASNILNHGLSRARALQYQWYGRFLGYNGRRGSHRLRAVEPGRRRPSKVLL